MLVVEEIEGPEFHEDCFLRVFVPIEEPAGLKEKLLDPKEEVVELDDGRGS